MKESKIFNITITPAINGAETTQQQIVAQIGAATKDINNAVQRLNCVTASQDIINTNRIKGLCYILCDILFELKDMQEQLINSNDNSNGVPW